MGSNQTAQEGRPEFDANHLGGHRGEEHGEDSRFHSLQFKHDSLRCTSASLQSSMCFLGPTRERLDLRASFPAPTVEQAAPRPRARQLWHT